MFSVSQYLFRSWDILEGIDPGGRFGSALTSLGDIDRDGYDDLAVGAPYAASESAYTAGWLGSEAHGSVVIFRGGPRGIDKTPAQIIRANQFDTKIRGFGFAISGGTDLDGNG